MRRGSILKAEKWTFRRFLGLIVTFLIDYFSWKYYKCFFWRWVNSESLPNIFLLLLFPLIEVPQIFSYRLVNFQFQSFNTFWSTVHFLHSSLSKELDPDSWFLGELFWACPNFYWTFQGPFSMTIFLGHLYLIQGNFLSLFANTILPHSSWFFSLFYKSVFIEQWVFCIHIRPRV